MFGPAELRLRRIAKDLLDVRSFARLDPLVQILEGPTQLPAKARPTLLLPAPMNPTRNTARAANTPARRRIAAGREPDPLRIS